MALNPRQEAFVAEFLKDKNATKAAARAGYSATSARQSGSRLLADPAVRERIDKVLTKTMAAADVTRHDVVDGLLAIARGTGPASARVRAWELLGKDIGMWSERDQADTGQHAEIAAAVERALAEPGAT